MIARTHRGIFAAYLSSLVGIAALALIAYWLADRQTLAAEWVARTERVLAQVETIQRGLLEAESTGRAFIISANPRQLEKFSRKLHDAGAEIDEFAELVGGDSSQLARIAELRFHMDERFPHMSDVMWAREHRGFEAALQLARSGAGVAGMESIHRTLESMKAAERALLDQRMAHHRRITLYSKALLVAMVIGGCLLATLLLRYNAREITRRVEAERKAAGEARTDALTGLPNRTSLYERLPPVLSAARRHGHPMALLYVDLDGFKEVNDALGHAAGDAVLRDAAQRLTKKVRAEDIVCRLGGDEFVVALTVMDDAQSAGSVAAKIIDAVSRPYVIGRERARIGASVGIALCSRDCGSVDDLLSAADAALYQAKAAGKGCYRFRAPRPTDPRAARKEREESPENAAAV